MKYNVYIGDIKSKEDLISLFNITEIEIKYCNILLAYVIDGGYEGSAFVLFEKDNILYEVNSYHCSCYGFEWEPEITSKEELLYRIKNGRKEIILGTEDFYFYTDWADGFSEELISILDSLPKNLLNEARKT